MTLSIYLGIFDWCPNCSWWLILLLLGAWILGWLLWNWTKGSRLESEKNGLNSDIKNWKKKFTETESDLAQAKYDREKVSGEFATVKSKLADSDFRYRALEEKYTQIESTSGGNDVDVSKWENHIVDLEGQLEKSRSTNFKLQDDYSALKNKFTEMQTQLDSNDYESGETNNDEHIQALEEQQSRIADLEKKLALSYEANTKMEADYAHLKTNFGDMEMNLHEATDVDTEDFSAEREGLEARITELELLLASRPTEEESKPGEGKKKKKAKKKKNKKKKKGKGKGKNKQGEKQGSGGQNSGYALAFADSNLQIVEGIGPKIEGVLKAEGVNSWKGLSQTDTAKLREILDNAGPRYKMHDPSSWAQQADLADKNNWDKLVVLQKVLGSPDGKESDSKAEKLYLKFLGFANVKQNDHKVIEGIGPKIEGLLKDGGIKTWKELSESKVEDIQVILDAAGSRYKLANPSTWPKQAKLAADGDWTALKNYQDKLKGGKE
ncbi:MAG: putative flap endonuclease-1-like 5' DNA nuclease/putative nuclease with TOPRIM domain [Granulosicoccus sp.]|jgi:predicted flap endonuclease-1-like 5' DNA nuclease/predicted nuclease with TOPRIM domain